MDAPGGFENLIGLKLDAVGADEITGHLVVQDHHKQAIGLVHGGVYASMAESMASIGAWKAAGADKLVMGTSNHTSFLRAVTEGTIRAVGRPRHQGRTTAVWDVELTDDDGRLCAIVRVSLAIRDPQPSR